MIAEELTNVFRAGSWACLETPSTAYKAAVENGGIDALIDKSRRKPNIKNRVAEMIEAAVLDYAVEQPAHGQARVSNDAEAWDFHLPQRGKVCACSSTIWAASGVV